jgi:UDP-galactopyranose mutase
MPPDMAYDVIKGMITRGADDPQGDDFQSWAIRAFGRGAYQHFMGPYNAKVWATPPDQMSSDWMAERVSEPSLEAVLRNLTHGTVEKAWGPNSMFSFPSAGGTGEIWRRVAKTLRNPIIYDARTVRIDTGRRVIYFADGRTTTYDKLISTMPLNQLIEQSDLHKGQNLLETMKLRHNQVMVIGVGFAETRLPDWSWAYYPQPRDEIPFYRVTNFTKYAKANAPMTRHRDRVGTGPAVGYMCEIAFTANEVIPPRDVLFERCIKSLVELDIAEHCNWDTETLSLWAEHLPYAYPVPTPGRVEALAVLQPQLRKRGVLSRGRFGAWRYEYGNQDHSYQQGLEAARNLLLDEPETMITD